MMGTGEAQKKGKRAKGQKGKRAKEKKGKREKKKRRYGGIRHRSVLKK